MLLFEPPDAEESTDRRPVSSAARPRVDGVQADVVTLLHEEAEPAKSDFPVTSRLKTPPRSCEAPTKHDVTEPHGRYRRRPNRGAKPRATGTPLRSTWPSALLRDVPYRAKKRGRAELNGDNGDVVERLMHVEERLTAEPWLGNRAPNSGRRTRSTADARPLLRVDRPAPRASLTAPDRHAVARFHRSLHRRALAASAVSPGPAQRSQFRVARTS